jgi:hypothetical protein
VPLSQRLRFSFGLSEGLARLALELGGGAYTRRIRSFLLTMGAERKSRDRRRAGRPQNGDTKPCPKCVESVCDFNERYRVPGSGIAPGWICDSPACGYRELVRARDGSIRSSRELQARARRQIMRARALTERFRARLAKSVKKTSH